MIPELGNFSLMLALALSLGLAIFPAIGVRSQEHGFHANRFFVGTRRFSLHVRQLFLPSSCFRKR